ncbi:class I SAM-dependent methyltransferase [Sphingomonas prati]|uniref:Phospholipid N-methyltransferase n=1 Tax=Sphingomonas prati TaxID=1843237 RepID=A0A7W9BSZ3_9SPHN|nr:methyltransferase domain-containing protein [Sphingomonas prati]MBB5729053.1 phospholipid N-methyltransferase [Sphingomonas prati]GGE85453.1 SAM-dependent methyltransferase [Sphingomonas prati]
MFMDLSYAAIGKIGAAARPIIAKPANGRSWDMFRFLLEWLRDPAGTAAVAPSGKALASLITHRIGRETGAVLELGPGTGVFTQALVDRGVIESDLTLVEQNQTFVRLLRQRFPRATVLSIDAAGLGRSQDVGSRKFGAAVCGLGLRSMDPEQVEAIIHAAFERLMPEGALYLFTYGWRCSVPDDMLDRLGLVAERVGTTLRNVPPASAYRLARLSAVR